MTSTTTKGRKTTTSSESYAYLLANSLETFDTQPYNWIADLNDSLDFHTNFVLVHREFGEVRVADWVDETTDDSGPWAAVRPG